MYNISLTIAVRRVYLPRQAAEVSPVCRPVARRDVYELQLKPPQPTSIPLELRRSITHLNKRKRGKNSHVYENRSSRKSQKWHEFMNAILSQKKQQDVEKKCPK